MAYQKRTDRTGTEYFSFTYVDPTTRKKIRLPKRKSFHVRTLNAALDFQRNLDAQYEAVRLRIERKLDWKTKFYDLAKLSTEFKLSRMQDAPNSWKNSMLYLEQYVIPYFIAQPQGNNINLWSEMSADFKDHLMTVERTKFGGPLAYNTRNHIISTLNAFLEWAANRKKCNRQEKLVLFPDHMMNQRSVEDIYSDDDFKKVHASLGEVSGDEADLLLVLRHTGLRLNEALGLSLDDFVLGEPTASDFKKLFVDVGVKCRAYIFLRSQPSLKIVRANDGKVPRKDLKHKDRKRAEDKFRIIPIQEHQKDLFNVLATRVNTQRQLLKQKAYGSDRSDYEPAIAFATPTRPS